MIIVIDALNRDRFGDLLSEMYRLRARVFQDRLGWDVTVTDDGLEIDEFDALDPAHVISLDDMGNVVGCMRLLQTTGPHMLADVFVDILDGEPPLRSPQLWEATRFCVDTERLSRTGRARNSISYVTSEVMVGAFEYGRDAGVLDAVAVIDPVMNRVMIRSGNAPYDYLGKTADMGKVEAMAALLDCSDERINRIRAFAGIEGDVFLAEAEALALASRRTRKPAKSDLEIYCDEQIAAAATVTEKLAALRLKAALADRVRSHSDISA
ncbi:N-acyl-L-homoserine lactone synthetase [Roseovarius sp. MBR-78]|uniref:acyl-homoserine-lactone synthase n=1 Tax=Roseovarius sp. MBR-78 TaxID=3156460 RepID=UPI0033948902